jgi:hypothetical protein
LQHPVIRKDFYFSTRELIEIQSKFYYRYQANLGFFTVANTLKQYAEAVAMFFLKLSRTHNKKSYSARKDIKILELGPGTCFFAKNCIEQLEKYNRDIDYTVVDVNTNLEGITRELGLKFYNESFEDFARRKTGTYDFLICNEALDMWAGPHYIFPVPDRRMNVRWQVHDLTNKFYLAKKQLLNDLVYDDIYWEKIVPESYQLYLTDSDYILPAEKIFLPPMLKNILKKIKIGGIFHDYWSEEEYTSLRAGLVEKDYSKISKRYSSVLKNENHSVNHRSSVPLFNYSYQTLLNEKLSNFDKSTFNLWQNADIIPFGTVDVTYTPNIHELITALAHAHFLGNITSLRDFLKIFSPEISPLMLPPISFEYTTLVLFKTG